MKRHDEKFLTSDKSELFARHWESDNPKSGLIFIHGFAEHSGRYDKLAFELTKSGISCFSFDLPGHGKSQGKRGYIKDFDLYYNSISIFIELIQNRNRGLPLFLFGHSLGGLLAFRFVQKLQPKAISGVILSSPLFGLALSIPKIKKIMLPAMKFIIPKLTLNNEIDPTLLSHDQHIVKDYINDPLVHRCASAPFFYNLLDEMGKALQKAPMWQYPILLQHAGEDKIVDISATEKVCSVIHPKWITKIEYKGFYHEIFNEVARDIPIQDLKKWIGSKVEAQGGGIHPRNHPFA